MYGEKFSLHILIEVLEVPDCVINVFTSDATTGVPFSVQNGSGAAKVSYNKETQNEKEYPYPGIAPIYYFRPLSGQKN